MLLVHRSMIRRGFHIRPNRYRPSGNTHHSSDCSPHSHDFVWSHRYAHSKASSSTVHVGTSYEHLCARTLVRLDFRDLIRTGGRADKGIDLVGKWLPPSLRHGVSPPLNVVVQCKAVARKAGPEMIRELEGAMAGAPGEWRGQDTIGVLCAKREVTAGVRDALRRSKRGIVWVMVEDLDANIGKGDKMGGDGEEDKRGDGEESKDGDVDLEEKQEGRGGRIKQVLWNDRVQKLVGKGTGTGVIHVPAEDGGPMETEVLMSWNGAVSGYDHQAFEDNSSDSSRLL